MCVMGDEQVLDIEITNTCLFFRYDSKKYVYVRAICWNWFFGFLIFGVLVRQILCSEDMRVYVCITGRINYPHDLA